MITPSEFPTQKADFASVISSVVREIPLDEVAHGQQLSCRCGSPMKLLEKYVANLDQGRPKGEPKKRHVFYSCSRWPQCKGSIQAHHDGTPVGEVNVNEELKKARRLVHAWLEKFTGFTSTRKYALLRRLMGLPGNKCHAGQFDMNQCKKAIRKLGDYHRKHYKKVEG